MASTSMGHCRIKGEQDVTGHRTGGFSSNILPNKVTFHVSKVRMGHKVMSTQLLVTMSFISNP